MSATITPYMFLTLPEVSVTLGPEWATKLNVDVITKIDSHDHSLGSGAQLPLSSINISNWNFNGHIISELNSTAYQSLLVDTSSNNSIYFKFGEFFVRDGSGNFVQITSGGAVISGAAGSITVDAAAVSVPTFYYTDNGLPDDPVDEGVLQLWENLASGVPSKLTCADLTIYEQVAGIAGGVTFKAASGIVTTYALTLPIIPVSDSLLAINASGVITPTRDLILDTFTMNTSPTDKYVLMSNGGGVGTWKQIVAASIATDAVETLKIKDLNVTRAKLVAVGQQLSASSGAMSDNNNTFTDIPNLTLTITTTGRPVFIALQSDGSGNPASIGLEENSSASPDVCFRIMRGVFTGGVWVYTEISQHCIQAPGSAFSTKDELIPAQLFHIDVPAANTYIYKLQAKRTIADDYVVNYATLIAYEL